LDLSFDAVVKFFSCGFLFSTIWAFVYETAVTMLLSVVEYGVFIPLFVSEEIDDAKGDMDMKKMAMAFMHDYLWLVIVALALNAFVVAALVEELCKYFGFWMVEHPDFLSPHDLDQLVGISLTSSTEKDTVSAEHGEADDALAQDSTTRVNTTAAPVSDKTLASTGAGITIAMVAAALGFACCENLMYIFVYTPTSSFGAGTCLQHAVSSVSSFLVLLINYPWIG
jgi:RsiW-degrading membrane proteinase PrsW (M82 family)